MSQVGRNDPCPCGSGKKFKKCCLAQSSPLPTDSADHGDYYQSARSVASQSPIRGGRIQPYTVLKLTEKPESAGKDPQMQQAYQRYIQRCWTLAKVAAMTTDQIEAQLRSFGVDHTADRFHQLSQGLHSAWDVSEKWFASDRVSCRGLDEDFLGVAACELWKRLLPERPSIEMVDDWIEDGHQCEYTDEVAACEPWWKAWCALYPRLQPKMDTMDSTTEVYDGTYLLFNWCQSFETALHNASRRDPGYIEIGKRYCTEWLVQFVGEGDDFRVRFTGTLAEFTCKLGQVDEARAILEKALDSWPKNPWTYVHLSDAWSHLFADRTHHFPFDVEKARLYLLLGLSRLKNKRDRQVLQERLEGLDEAVHVSEKPWHRRPVA